MRDTGAGHTIPRLYLFLLLEWVPPYPEGSGHNPIDDRHMGSPAILDFDSLLQPIPGESPVGSDPREDDSPTPIFYEIKDARSAATSAARQGEFEDVVGGAEAVAWGPVTEVGKTILKERAKDLQVATWMTESLSRSHGFAGMRDGFKLTRLLIETFWDGVFPVPDEDGMETKVAPIAGLNGAGREGTLIAPIQRIPITEGGSKGPFAYWDLVRAEETERFDDERKAARIAEGGATLEDIRTACAETSQPFFIELVDDIQGALGEWKALEAALGERCEGQDPPTSRVRDMLQDLHTGILRVVGDRLPAQDAPPQPVAEGSPSAGDAPAAAAPPTQPAGAIQSREDALAAVTKIAEFFRKSEPHSPIPFLLDRAVRWGRMPLPALLNELIPDSSALSTFDQLTGVLGSKNPE